MGHVRERGGIAFSRRRAISPNPLAGRQIPIGKHLVWVAKVRVPGSAPDTVSDSDGDRRRHKGSDLGPKRGVFPWRRPPRSDSDTGRRSRGRSSIGTAPTPDSRTASPKQRDSPYNSPSSHVNCRDGLPETDGRETRSRRAPDSPLPETKSGQRWGSDLRGRKGPSPEIVVKGSACRREIVRVMHPLLESLQLQMQGRSRTGMSLQGRRLPPKSL